jgi:hypothetical protein
MLHGWRGTTATRALAHPPAAAAAEPPAGCSQPPLYSATAPVVYKPSLYTMYTHMMHAAARSPPRCRCVVSSAQQHSQHLLGGRAARASGRGGPITRQHTCTLMHSLPPASGSRRPLAPVPQAHAHTRAASPQQAVDKRSSVHQAGTATRAHVGPVNTHHNTCARRHASILFHKARTQLFLSQNSCKTARHAAHADNPCRAARLRHALSHS